MIDLSQATFIIPIRIESPDRLRNVITTTAFILENFDTNIIIKEVDSESVFERDALPILKQILDVDVKVKHIVLSIVMLRRLILFLKREFSIGGGS